MKTNQEVNNQKMKKAVYEKPAIEVIEMELEAICQTGSGGAGGGGDFNPGGGGGLG